MQDLLLPQVPYSQVTEQPAQDVQAVNPPSTVGGSMAGVSEWDDSKHYLTRNSFHKPIIVQSFSA